MTCTNKAAALYFIKAYLRANQVWIHFFLYSKLDGGERSASLPSRITPEKGNCRYPFNRMPAGPRGGLDVLEKTKIPCHYSRSSAVLPNPRPSYYTDKAIQNPSPRFIRSVTLHYCPSRPKNLVFLFFLQIIGKQPVRRPRTRWDNNRDLKVISSDIIQ